MHAPRPLIFSVHGTPATKGSLRHVGHGRLIEGNKNSSEWRTSVALAARSAMHSRMWTTVDGPAHVLITLWIARPQSVNYPLPHTRSSGDVDKHARNILDALVDAGVLSDDSRVVSLLVRKVFVTDGKPGARVAVVVDSGQVGLWMDLWTEWLVGCGAPLRDDEVAPKQADPRHNGQVPRERLQTMNLLTGSAKAKLALSILNARADSDAEGALRDVRIVLDGSDANTVFADIAAARSTD